MILPIIGHKVKMPVNPEMKAIVEAIMHKDGMSMAQFNSHAQMVAISATGSYRKIMQKATDVTYDIIKSSDPGEDLLTPNYLEQPDPTPTLDPESDSVYKAVDNLYL